jgi:2-polyprenyl-3-methyl-5-hydroxy-6-metoxy-1,4-benzoquinol methylase
MATADDFRTSLYGSYVSGFKGAQGAADAWWTFKYLPLLRDVDPNARILDLGCGDGRLVGYLARRGFTQAVGVDVSPEQVAIAQSRGLDVACADLFAYLDASSEPYAAILAVDILEHLTRDELIRLAPLLFHALQPGGRLLVQTANGAGLMPGHVVYGDLTHQTIFTPESLGQLLRPVGFEHLSFYETGPVPIRLRGKLDVAAWSVVRTVAALLKYVETGKRQAIWTENFICRAFRPD